MNNVIVSVGAVTYAIKLKKLLLRYGIQARLVKIDGDGQGCTHGIEIPGEKYYQAVVIMKENNISYSVKNQKR